MELRGVGLPEPGRVIQEAALDLAEQHADQGRHPVERNLFPAPGVAPDNGHPVLRQIAGTQLDSHGYALDLPLEELRARSKMLTVVELDANPGGAHLARQSRGSLENRRVGVARSRDRDHHNLMGSDGWRQPQPAIVPVRHHQSADQP